MKVYLEYWAWKVGLRRYCTPCDEIYCGWRPGGHRKHHCGFYSVIFSETMRRAMGRGR